MVFTHCRFVTCTKFDWPSHESKLSIYNALVIRKGGSNIKTCIFFFCTCRRRLFGKIYKTPAQRSIQMDWRSVLQIPTQLMTIKMESVVLNAPHVLRDRSPRHHVALHWFVRQLASVYHARQVPTQIKPTEQRVKSVQTAAQKRS